MVECFMYDLRQARTIIMVHRVEKSLLDEYFI
jgi:hypothetical protein